MPDLALCCMHMSFVRVAVPWGAYFFMFTVLV